jgi:transposase
MHLLCGVFFRGAQMVVKAVALDETASKRRHNTVTTFIDLERTEQPVVFATPGKGKETVSRFKDFLAAHHGRADRIAEEVYDMSQASADRWAV